MSKLNQSIQLADSRRLGYAEYGSGSGFPIIYFHGSQSSRLEMHYDMSFAKQNNLRIITVDRPGHGNSDINPNGTLLSFAHDIKQLTDNLNLSKFSLVGMSAGAPFALAMAYSFPIQVVGTSIISGFAPFNSESKRYLTKQVKSLLTLAKAVPFLLKILLKFQSKQLKKNSQKALKGFLSIMSEPDQEILKNPEVLGVIETMFVEAFKQGEQGVSHEISKLLVKDWGFELSDIVTPVSFWQGQEDKNVPKEWAELMASKIPNSSLTLIPNEGHLIIFTHGEKIFSQLASE